MTSPVPNVVAPAPKRRAMVFGTGFGVVIGRRDLEAAIVRARPSGATLIAQTVVADFRNRPAAEWGAELLRFVAHAGQGALAATVLLPRDEVIVRTLSLPGVTDRDAASAIELQIDTLHPWASDNNEDEVVWGWARAGGSNLIVGLARKSVVDAYETVFSEAGISLAAVTFSSAVIYPAIRQWSTPPVALLAMRSEGARTEVYGESEGRGMFSAEFSLNAARALALSRAELRLPADYPAVELAEILPKSGGSGAIASSLAWAAGITGAVSRNAKFANLLPAERRASHNRVQYIVPAALGVLLAIALIVAFVVYPALEQRSLRAGLDRESRRLQPIAAHAQSLDKQIAASRTRVSMLDEFRRRPQSDLDILNELTRMLPPPAWTSGIEIFPDSVTISGETDQAAPLLKLLDSSPLFQNSEFTSSVTRNKDTELFRIRTMRRGRAGRTTP